MAIFNPQAPVVSSTDDTNRSRGIGTSKIFSTLFGGIAETGEAWIKARDEQIQNQIYKDVSDQTDQITKPYLDALDPSKMTAEDAARSGSLVSGSGQNTFGAGRGGPPRDHQDLPPPEAQRDLQGVSKLQAALQAGTIRQAYYDNQLLSMVKGIKAKYPGYERQIDSIVSSVTGKNPRNALMSDFYEEASANAAMMSSQGKAWQSWVNQNQDKIAIVDPTYFEHPQDYQDQRSQAQLQSKVAHYEADQTVTDARLKAIALKKAEGQDTADDSLQMGLEWAGKLARQMTNTALDSSGDFMTRLRKAQTDPGVIDPSEVQYLTQQAGAIKTAQLAAVNDFIYSNDLPSSIRDDAKLDQIRAAAIKPIDDILQAITNKDYGLATLNAQASKSITDATLRQVYETMPRAQLDKALSEIYGDNAWTILSNTNPALMADSQNMWQKLGVAYGAAGVPGMPSLKVFTTTLKPAIDQGKVDPNTIPKTIDGVLSILKDPKAPPEAASNVVNYLFGPDNTDFLKTFGQAGDSETAKTNTLDQQTALFTKLTAPDVAQRVHDLSRSNPQLWVRYTQWFAPNFHRLFLDSGEQLSKAILDRPYIAVQWDPQAVQFQVTDTDYHGPTNTSMLRASGQGKPLYEYFMESSARAAVSRMNQQLTSAKAIAELSGRDPSEEVLKLLIAMGVPISPGGDVEPSEGNIWSMMANGIARAAGFEVRPGRGFGPLIREGSQ